MGTENNIRANAFSTIKKVHVMTRLDVELFLHIAL